MNGVFYRCNNLKLLNLASFDNKNVKDMALLYDYYHNLSSIHLYFF